jgi:ATP-dependent DNA helicase RecQ
MTETELSDAVGLPRREVKVIVSQLESAGISQRRRGKVTCVHEIPSEYEMNQLLSSDEQRHSSDRQKVEWMMRYGETTSCRMQFIREYFGYNAAVDCGHCDNCNTGSKGKLVVNETTPTKIEMIQSLM